jgi:hypothetical protein
MRGGTALGLLVVLSMMGVPRAAEAQGKINRDHSTYTNLRDEGYPVRTDPEVVPASESGLRDDEMVLGVVIGGEARAYPVNLMWEPENEVLNDTLGGAAITATW